MDINIEQLPFAAAVLNRDSLCIEDANEKFYSLFLIEGRQSSSIMEYRQMEFLRTFIYDNEEEEIRLDDVNFRDKLILDITVKKQKNKVFLFFHDRAVGESTQESDMMARLSKLKEERQQFITMSAELKTKCDIIEMLRRREKEYMMHLKDVMNNISEGLIVLNREGKYSFSNKALFNIMDVNMANLMNYPDIFPRYDIIKINESNPDEECSDIFNYKQVVRNSIILLKHKDTGERKYIEFSNIPINNELDEFVYSIVTLKDVTGIKLHEILVQEQSSFINDVINTMDIPIAVVTYPQLEVTLVNEQLRSTIRKSADIKPDKLFGKTVNILEALSGSNYSKLTDMILKCGEKGAEGSYSPLEINTYDEKKYYKVKFKPLKDTNKRTNLILISAADITEEICRSLELENITNMKDEFFAVMSHELRTPLTVIYSSLQLAYSVYGNEITPNIGKNLLRISQNCSRLLKLINNILDISKAEAGFLSVNSVDFDIIEVTEYIVSSINTYARVKEIDMQFVSDFDALDISMDKDKYEKILLNLLSNAMKFTPKGKKITVTLDADETIIRLSVKDEGIGIPEDKINSIFDRFAQVNSSLSRRAEGTGLGLALVKKFVDIMGGTIEVKSIMDCGTEFIVSFKRNSSQGVEKDNFSLMDVNVKEKINIEFSDID